MQCRFLFCFLASLAIYGSDQPAGLANPDSDSGVESIKFSDDFRSDSRDRYEVQGPVEWETEQLTLRDGASIGLKIQAGATVTLALKLGFSPPTTHSENSETRVLFALDSYEVTVVLTRNNEGGEANGEIRILNRYKDEEGRTIKEVIAVSPVSGLPPDGASYRFSYHYGLVTVESDGARLAAGYIAGGADSVAAWRVSQHNTDLQIKHVDLEGTGRPTPLTAEQERLVAQAKQWADRADKAYEVAEYAEAERLIIDACGVLRPILGEGHLEHVQSLVQLAQVYCMRGEYAEAEPLFLQAFEVRRRILGESHPEYAAVLHCLGWLHNARGQYAKAEALHREAMKIRADVLGEEHPDYASSVDSLAALYASIGRYADAEQFYTQALEVYKRVAGQESEDYAQTLNNLGVLYWSIAEYAKAEQLYLEAMGIRKRRFGILHPRYATTLHNLGLLYSKTNDNAKAERLLTQALEIRRKVLGEEHPDFATSLNNVAALYWSVGEYARAESLYIQALNLREKLLGKDHPQYATVLHNLAELYRTLRQFTKAEPLFMQALETDKKIGVKRPTYATRLNSLARLYAASGQYPKAKPLLAEALEILEETVGVDHPEYAVTLSGLASVQWYAGDYAEAQRLFTQVGDLLPKNHVWYYANLANIATVSESLGKYAEAQQLYEEGVRALLQDAELTLPSLSEGDAMAWLRVRGFQLDPVLFNARRLNDHPGAMGRNAAEIYEFVWRTQSLATRMQARRRLGLDASSEARGIHEQLSQTRRHLAQVTLAVPPPDRRADFASAIQYLNQQKEQLEEKLAQANVRTARSLAIRDATVGQLMEVLPHDVAVLHLLRTYFWHPTSRQVETTDGTRDGSSEGERYEAFVLTPSDNSIEWVHLGPAEPIDEAIKRWRGEIQQQSGRGPKLEPQPLRTAQQADSPQLLRELIWEKIEPHLQDCKTIIVIPDGQLHALPWGALPGSRPQSYLIEDYAIATAPFGQQIYGWLEQEPVTSQGLIVAGGIDYGQLPLEAADARREAQDPQRQARLAENFERAVRFDKQLVWEILPQSRTEAEGIAELFRDHAGGDVVQFAGRQAGELDVADALTRARYVHLATHGFFADRDSQSAKVFSEDPHGIRLFGASSAVADRGGTLAGRNPFLLTGVVLSGANLGAKRDEHGLPNGEDGILTGEEVDGLNLSQTELVVLSACETALGDLHRSEGVFGLQLAFARAGARSTIASLWRIEDQATQALMIEFYRNLWQRKLGKLEALRQAQLAMIRGYDRKTGRLTGEQGAGGTEQGAGGGEQGAGGGEQGESRGTQPLHPYYWAAFSFSGDWR